MNKVFLMGHLGQDPELRSTSGGTAVCNLRLATTERRKDRDGNWTDHTEWHSVVAWGRTAENAAQYLKKGAKVLVEGKLQTRKWQDRDGKDRYTTEVVVERFEFAGSGSGERRPDTRSDERSAARDDAPPAFDDEVPF